jgi:hypothetical protein
VSEILYQKIEKADGKELADITLAKQIADVLDRHYPGHMWAVNVDSVGGVATVKNLRLSGNWGFLLHIGDVYSGSEFDKRVMMAGGELLERFKLHAGRFSQSQYDILPMSVGRQLEVSL